MSTVALPDKRVALASDELVEEVLVILVFRLPLAKAVICSVRITGFPSLSVLSLLSVKSNLAVRTPLNLAVPGSAVPLTVPLKTRPWANMTNVPVDVPLVGTPIENTPNEFAEQPVGSLQSEKLGLSATNWPIS